MNLTLPTIALMLIYPLSALAQTPVLKIGLVADVQYCNCETAGAREYSKSLTKLDEAAKAINSEKVDMTVELGDLIDRDYASFDPVLRLLNSLKSRWVFIPGNHDFNVADSLKKKVWKMIPAKKGYWSEVVGNIRLLYLNGFQNSVIAYTNRSRDFAENAERLKKLEEEKAKNASDWNGGLGRKQLDWIKDQVTQASLLKQTLLVFGHQPIIPDEAHSMWDSRKLLEILSGYHGQVLYFCGHKHSGGDHSIGNTRIINLKGMVEQPQPSFGILTVYPDHFILKGFGELSSLEGQR